MNTPRDPLPTLPTELVTTESGLFAVLRGDTRLQRIKQGQGLTPALAYLIHEAVTEGAHVIDVGANLGLTTVPLARAVGHTGVVVAIEPLRVIFQQLCGNCFLNGLANVLTLNAAVGDVAAIAEFEPVNYFATSRDFGDSRLGKGGERVQSITLDSLGLPNTAFIAISARSSAYAVIQGAKQTIFAGRPLLFVEIDDLALQTQGASSVALIESIKSLGYVLLHIKDDSEAVYYACLPIERKGEIARFGEILQSRFDVLE
jgi:FkbM family methyltransferase